MLIQRREEQRQEHDSSRAIIEAVQAQTAFMKSERERLAVLDEKRMEMEMERTKSMSAMMAAISERLAPRPASNGK